MSFFPCPDPVLCDKTTVDAIETLVIPRTSDIGGLEVRRALPTVRRRLVGPFIFFDRMGPAVLRDGDALDVRPHPHIGLSTVTYLFDGHIRHRDSLGTEMVIQPGDVNLMTAGRGIVHSERSPEEERSGPLSISGVQTWLALPEQFEEINPEFFHTNAPDLPLMEDREFKGRLIIGSIHGVNSPVIQHAETLYADIEVLPGGRFHIPPTTEERAIYTLRGNVGIGGEVFPPDRLLAFRPGDDIIVRAGPEGAHFMLFGGAALGSKRYIWWNFVSSSKERIEQAKEEWRTGRFDIVPGDEDEFVPLPE
ncbi:pirin C-terminal cupin domain protein [Ochrobactrum quorumnocens]|uniref:Pirin C-terminal cupin domain protein n=1 Tax=Ochrobactrum quorumnocens TaxID=271865 RepID=A0A248UJZ7_9HYPH|nr:pirin family protein [[Ochrobactrum] quorumnocens]ASV87008.1 pirin C-terminal cupin domain protein [[Ochrobactrum] quorumnocens]